MGTLGQQIKQYSKYAHTLEICKFCSGTGYQFESLTYGRCQICEGQGKVGGDSKGNTIIWKHGQWVITVDVE